VVNKKVSTLPKLKRVFRFFIPLKEELEELDDHNLKIVFKVEKDKRHTNSGYMEAELRLGLSIIF